MLHSETVALAIPAHCLDLHVPSTRIPFDRHSLARKGHIEAPTRSPRNCVFLHEPDDSRIDQKLGPVPFEHCAGRLLSGTRLDHGPHRRHTRLALPGNRLEHRVKAFDRAQVLGNRLIHDQRQVARRNEPSKVQYRAIRGRHREPVCLRYVVILEIVVPVHDDARKCMRRPRGNRNRDQRDRGSRNTVKRSSRVMRNDRIRQDSDRRSCKIGFPR